MKLNANRISRGNYCFYVFFLRSKFELVPPPPGWSQQEMEAPFAIPPHLQDSAAELEASYKGLASDMLSTSSAPPPPPPPPPSIVVGAVTEYVSS